MTMLQRFALFIFLLLLLTGWAAESFDLVPRIPVPWDKLGHLLLFLVLGLMIYALLPAHRSLWWILAGCLAIGAAQELNQMHLPRHSASLVDFLFDGIGALLAVALARWRRASQ